MTDILSSHTPRRTSDGGRRSSRGTSISTVASISTDMDEGCQTNFNHHDASTATPSEKRSHSIQTDSPVRHSPRYEAFVMTGDKILNLNPKISPSYAKVQKTQLPPSVEVDNTTPKRRGPFDEIPGYSNSRIPIKNRRFLDRQMQESHSDHHLETNRTENGDESALTRKENTQEMPDENDFPSTTTLPEITGSRPTPQDTPKRIKYSSPASISYQQNRSSVIKEYEPDGETEPIVPNSVYRSTTSMPRSNEVNQPSITDAFGGSGTNMNNTSAEAFQRFVGRLFDLNGYTRMEVSNFFTKTSDLSVRVVTQFMTHFNFSGLRIDAALREFLDHVCLTGETSDRTRILTFFAERYHQCNPTLFESASTPESPSNSPFDAIHALSCALLLLNTDLHSDVTSKKMTVREFINNLSHTGFQFDRVLLKTLYNAIKSTPFQHNEVPQPRKGPTRVASLAQRKIRPVEDAVDYCHGWVMKKEIYDRDGKKTPFGRRKWQMHFATVRGLVLYLHKNERGFEGSQYNAFNNCIRLHHALAEKCIDYKKKQHVFRLITAKLGEFLIQTSSPEEMQRWINAVNFVAASLSTPVLPEPVSSKAQPTLQRPPLPDTISTLTVHEQLRRHKEKLDEMNQILSVLRDSAPSLKAKGKIVYDYFYKERFLDNERRRYLTYVDILQEKCAALSMTGSEAGIKKNAVTVQRNCTISTIRSEEPVVLPSRQSSVATNNKFSQGYRDGINSLQMGSRAESTETHRVESPVMKHSPISALAQAYAMIGKPYSQHSLDAQRKSDSINRHTAKGGAEPALCDINDLGFDQEELDEVTSGISDDDNVDLPPVLAHTEVR